MRSLLVSMLLIGCGGVGEPTITDGSGGDIGNGTTDGVDPEQRGGDHGDTGGKEPASGGDGGADGSGDPDASGGKESSGGAEAEGSGGEPTGSGGQAQGAGGTVETTCHELGDRCGGQYCYNAGINKPLALMCNETNGDKPRADCELSPVDYQGNQVWCCGDSEGPSCWPEDVCDPPKLVVFEGAGQDFNNVCGWTTNTAPAGYSKSGITIDCANPTALSRSLTNYQGIQYSPWVDIIDPDDTCTSGPMSQIDRSYSVTGKFCMKVSAPFERRGSELKTCEVHSTSGATDSTVTKVNITVSQVGWVEVESAAFVNGSCPLACDD